MIYAEVLRNSEEPMYSVARFCVLKELTERQVNELHSKENDRQFIFPAFYICRVFRLGDKAISGLSDVNQQKLREIFFKNSPDLKNMPANVVPSDSDLDYIHAWDWCLWHNADARAFFKGAPSLKDSLTDEIKQYDLKGAKD